MNESKTINRLTVKQSFALCRWLEDLQPTFDHTITYEKLAVKASDYFKCAITAHNVKGAFDVAELKLPSPPKTENQKIGILKRAVEILYKELNQPLPPEWSDM